MVLAAILEREDYKYYDNHISNLVHSCIHLGFIALFTLDVIHTDRIGEAKTFIYFIKT